MKRIIKMDLKILPIVLLASMGFLLGSNLGQANRDSIELMRNFSTFLENKTWSDEIEANMPGIEQYPAHRGMLVLSLKKALIGQVISPKSGEDCVPISKKLIRLKKILGEYLDGKALQESRGLRLVRIYFDLANKFDNICQKQFVAQCKFIANEMKPMETIDRSMAHLMIAKLSKCSTRLSLPMMKYSSQLERDDIKSLECAIKNKDLAMDKRWVQKLNSRRKFDPLMKKLIKKLPEYPAAKRDRARLVELYNKRFREPCNAFMRYKEPVRPIPEVAEMLEAAQDRQRFASILPAGDKCLEAISFYLSCQIEFTIDPDFFN